jgi:hypothetical protein
MSTTPGRVIRFTGPEAVVKANLIVGQLGYAVDINAFIIRVSSNDYRYVYQSGETVLTKVTDTASESFYETAINQQQINQENKLVNTEQYNFIQQLSEALALLSYASMQLRSDTPLNIGDSVANATRLDFYISRASNQIDILDANETDNYVLYKKAGRDYLNLAFFTADVVGGVNVDLYLQAFLQSDDTPLGTPVIVSFPPGENQKSIPIDVITPPIDNFNVYYAAWSPDNTKITILNALSDITTGAAVIPSGEHNEGTGLQGGQLTPTKEYYHFNAGEYTNLVNVSEKGVGGALSISGDADNLPISNIPKISSADPDSYLELLTSVGLYSKAGFNTTISGGNILRLQYQGGSRIEVAANHERLNRSVSSIEASTEDNQLIHRQYAEEKDRTTIIPWNFGSYTGGTLVGSDNSKPWYDIGSDENVIGVQAADNQVVTNGYTFLQITNNTGATQSVFPQGCPVYRENNTTYNYNGMIIDIDPAQTIDRSLFLLGYLQTEISGSFDPGVVTGGFVNYEPKLPAASTSDSIGDRLLNISDNFGGWQTSGFSIPINDLLEAQNPSISGLNTANFSAVNFVTIGSDNNDIRLSPNTSTGKVYIGPNTGTSLAVFDFVGNTVTAPLLDSTAIGLGGGKSLVTKEYGDANWGGTGGAGNIPIITFGDEDNTITNDWLWPNGIEAGDATTPTSTNTEFYMPYGGNFTAISWNTISGGAVGAFEIHKNGVLLETKTIDLNASPRGYGTLSSSFVQGDRITLRTTHTFANKPMVTLFGNL